MGTQTVDKLSTSIEELPFLPKQTACPWCASESLVSMYDAEPFHLDQCQTCGISFVNPQPEDSLLAQYYPPTYYPTTPRSRFVRDHLRWKRYDMHKVWPALADLKGGRHLDLGCGIGGILHASRDLGMETLGIEFCDDACHFGQRHFGLDLKQGTLQDYSFPRDEFAIVSMFHVFEHVRDPAAELSQMAQIVAPGGALVLECPNIQSWSARHFGANWFHMEVPRHLHHFHPTTVCERLEQLGFEVVHNSDYHPAHGSAAFFGSLYKPQSGLPLLEKIRRRVHVAAMRSIARPLARLESWLSTGSVFTLVARKK